MFYIRTSAVGAMLKKYILHFVLLILTCVGVWLENIAPNQTTHREEVISKFKSYVEKYDNAQKKLLTSYGYQSSLYPLQLFVFKGDSAVFWSSDKVAFKQYNISDSLQIKYLSFNDGFYRVCSQKDSLGFSHYSLLKLAHNFPNTIHGMPQNKAVKLSGIEDEIQLKSETHDSTYYPVSLNGQKVDFYVNILNVETNSDVSLWFYIPALILLLWLIIRLLVYKRIMSSDQYLFQSGFILFFLVTIRILLANELLLHFLSQSPMFSPELFAHSHWSSSYAENFLNIVILCFLLLFIRKIRILPSTISLFPALLIVNALLAGFIYWQLTEVQHLIIDSKINLDPVVIDELNVYTLLGIILIGLHLALLFVLCGLLVDWFAASLKRKSLVYYLSLVLQATFAGLVLWNGSFIYMPAIILAWMFLAFMVMYFVLHYNRDNENWIKMLLIVAFVLLNTFRINSLLEQKEHEYRKLYAYKILHERDLELERRLLEAEHKLESNNVFQSCIYEDSAFNEEEFEGILKYDYLIDFLSDFDIYIKSFSGSSNSWSDLQKQGFDNYYKIYMETSEDGLSHSFLKVKESSGFSGYISAHITGEYNSPEFQSVFILLRQKVRTSQKALSEFTGKSAGIPFSPFTYYHALYVNNKLSRVSPEFPFERFNEQFHSNKQEEFFIQNGYSIYVYHPEPERVLVLVFPLRTLANYFTVFAGLILSIFLIWFSVLSLRLAIRIITLNINRLFTRHKAKLYLPSFRNMLLQRKIQTALIVELILSFVAGTFMVANFISKNYEDTQQRQVLEKMRGISGELEKSGIMDFGNKTGPKREFLIDLSESYNLDISLFNLNGTLWLSSSPDLYKNAVINEYMNPVAYQKLTQDRLYSFNQNERLYGYKYSSFYQSFFDHQQKLTGYIHLPFFARQQETNRELTSLLVDMLNIFVIFFLITGVLSVFLSKVITRPLAIIALSLRKLRVGGENEAITWQSNDEIGQLVKTYNTVLHQLEVSIEKLALTEREGAWREMAKQVAHEIKNPLTPMRLSIQHLQRSVAETDPSIKEKIKKVSDLLVTQIDLMSKMAEEFSSFAKMPMAVPANIDISLMLRDMVDLFSNSEDFDISLEGLEKPAFILADKDQMKRVFTNLIKNAYQAKKEEETCMLSISAVIEGNILTIAFADNGVGIEDSLKEKIFHPNFSTKTSGMGLGLAISKKIIELAGGSIRFESTQGAGTIFYITLPLAKI